ncbi:MAG TPA: hypothetical protein VHZ76_06655, partial [Gammaproteobacteria bacterium]|nr:hypothetical protein [Gammaproteobacteria bacterium]
MKADYSKISPTAKIAAYWKSLSDIPYAKEIAEAVDAQQTTKEILGEKIVTMARFSPPIMEARYKAINIGISESRVDNILELACGLSPRGLTLAADNKVYVGSDLPEILSETAPVITSIAERLNIPANKLHYQPVNVLSKDELGEA